MLKELNQTQYPYLNKVLEDYKKRQDPQVMCSKCKSKNKMATYYWAKRDGTIFNKYVCGECGYVYRDYLTKQNYEPNKTNKSILL